MGVSCLLGGENSINVLYKVLLKQNASTERIVMCISNLVCVWKCLWLLFDVVTCWLSVCLKFRNNMCICALLVYVHDSLFNLLSYIQMCLPMWRIKKGRYELQTVMILLINCTYFPTLSSFAAWQTISVARSQETKFLCFTNISRLMLFREIICLFNHTEPMNKIYGKKCRAFNVRAGGKCTEMPLQM